MANYSAIKAAVNAYIKANGRKEITGSVLNAVLNATIDSLGRFFQFAGGAMPTDDPGTPDQNVCYLATEPGLYTHFGNIRIANEEVALLFWNGEWVKESIALGIQEVNASVDNQVGTPSVDVSYSGGQLVLTFHNLKGETGETGDDAGFGTIGADITGGVGTPGVSVETSGSNTAKNIMFHFTNLKGETGVTSVIATIDNTSGTPSCQVSLVNGVLTLAFSGLKGLQGNTGSSVDYPFTIANNLTTDDPTQALSAAMGVQLEGEISQLAQKVNGLYYDIDVNVDTNSDRSKNYLFDPGTKIVIKVTKVAGTGTTYNAYWIKSGGNEAIFTGEDYGYVSDVLTVPDDATGVNIFFGAAATGNVKHLKIYDATLPAYISESYPQMQEDVETLLEKAVNFTGTDGTNPGTAGFVPAPAASDKDKLLCADGTWKVISDYFYNENVSVNTNAQRFKSYPLAPGSRFVLKVSKISGTSATFNLYWIKSGGNELVHNGYPIGYLTDILTVPDDATGVQIFMTPAASGNVNKIEIWDATKTGFLVEKIGQSGFDFLNNRKMISKTVTIPANNSAMDLVSLNEGLLAGLSGDIYAYISCSPKIADDKEIQFWNTEDSASRSVGIHGIEMRQDRVFKIWNNKTFSKISVAANVVTTSTEVTIVVFAIIPSDTYLKYPLYGKKVMCFGDSITEFKSSIDNKRYSDHLQEYSQATVVNAGIGGTRLAQRLTPSLTPTDNQYCVAAFDICNMVIAWATGDYSIQDAALASGFLTSEQQSLYEGKIATLRANPIEATDIVTIFGGTNDYTGGSLIGAATADNIDKGTIYGAVNSMVSAIIAAKPTMKIYFFLPIIRMFQNTISLATSSDIFVPQSAPEGKTLPEFCEVIANAVELNHCPFCDWYWSLGWNVYNFTTYFGDDYTHPFRGFRYLAEKMYKFLLSK